MPTATANRPGKNTSAPPSRMTPEEAKAAQHAQWAKLNEEKYRKSGVTLRDLAEAGQLFEKGHANPAAAKLMSDADKARAFLKECEEDSALRALVLDQGLDLESLADWIRSGGKST